MIFTDVYLFPFESPRFGIIGCQSYLLTAL